MRTWELDFFIDQKVPVTVGCHVRPPLLIKGPNALSSALQADEIGWLAGNTATGRLR
jgi:hypothetical protein